MIEEALRRYGGAEFAQRHGQKVRYLLAGGLNTAVGLAAYPALYFLLAPLGVHYLGVLGASQVFCIGFAYLTNKFLVFKTKGNYARETSRFVAFHAAYFVLNLLVLGFLVERLDIPPVWAQMGFAVLVIITSYLWHSKITFSTRPS
jgi:putative flippase GtrA